mmetsp:Transcript_59478/g.138534  ORF Transcript_59478/g.138534 Transcript_59478/m.138534 type:complete len:213 (+) Transcript_59478:1248-1886(+)
MAAKRSPPSGISMYVDTRSRRFRSERCTKRVMSPVSSVPQPTMQSRTAQASASIGRRRRSDTHTRKSEPQSKPSSLTRSKTSSSNFSTNSAFNFSICSGVFPATILMIACSFAPPLSKASLRRSQSPSKSTLILGWTLFRTANRQFLKDPFVSVRMCSSRSFLNLALYASRMITRSCIVVQTTTRMSWSSAVPQPAMAPCKAVARLSGQDMA